MQQVILKGPQKAQSLQEHVLAMYPAPAPDLNDSRYDIRSSSCHNGHPWIQKGAIVSFFSKLPPRVRIPFLAHFSSGPL